MYQFRIISNRPYTILHCISILLQSGRIYLSVAHFLCLCRISYWKLRWKQALEHVSFIAVYVVYRYVDEEFGTECVVDAKLPIHIIFTSCWSSIEFTDENPRVVFVFTSNRGTYFFHCTQASGVYWVHQISKLYSVLPFSNRRLSYVLVRSIERSVRKLASRSNAWCRATNNFYRTPHLVLNHVFMSASRHGLINRRDMMNVVTNRPH